MATSFRYREVEGGIRLLGSHIEDEDLVIPVEYEGHPVVEIERQTFFKWSDRTCGCAAGVPRGALPRVQLGGFAAAVAAMT